MLAVAIFVLEGYAPLGMVCKGERERVVRRLAGHAAAAVGVESSTRRGGGMGKEWLLRFLKVGRKLWSRCTEAERSAADAPAWLTADVVEEYLADVVEEPAAQCAAPPADSPAAPVVAAPHRDRGQLRDLWLAQNRQRLKKRALESFGDGATPGWKAIERTLRKMGTNEFNLLQPDALACLAAQRGGARYGARRDRASGTFLAAASTERVLCPRMRFLFSRGKPN